MSEIELVGVHELFAIKGVVCASEPIDLLVAISSRITLQFCCRTMLLVTGLASCASSKRMVVYRRDRFGIELILFEVAIVYGRERILNVCHPFPYELSTFDHWIWYLSCLDVSTLPVSARAKCV